MAWTKALGDEPCRIILSYLIPRSCLESKQRSDGPELDDAIIFHQDACWFCLARQGFRLLASHKESLLPSCDTLWRLLEAGKWSFPRKVEDRLREHAAETSHLRDVVRFVEKTESKRTRIHNCPCEIRLGGHPQLDMIVAKQLGSFRFQSSDLARIANAPLPEPEECEGDPLEDCITYSSSLAIERLPDFEMRLELGRVCEAEAKESFQSTVSHQWALRVVVCLRNPDSPPPVSRSELAVEVCFLSFQSCTVTQNRFVGVDDLVDNDNEGVVPLGRDCLTCCNGEMMMDDLEALKAYPIVPCAVAVSVCTKMRFGTIQAMRRLCSQHRLSENVGLTALGTGVGTH